MGNVNQRLWGKDYVIVMAASTGISFCNYFFFSTLPIYAQNITGTAAYAGLMTGVYTFAALVARPFCGILSDAFGRTRLLIAGAFLCVVACLLYNWAAVLTPLILVRVLHGMGFGMHSTAGGAVAADVIPKPRLAEGIGYFGLYGTIAAALAPGIALSIIGDGETGAFKALFILAAVVSLASLILDCFITYERKKKSASDDGARLQRRTAGEAEVLPKTFLGFEYAVFLPSAVVILLFVALSSIVSFIPLFSLERNLGNVGLFFTVNAAGLFLSRVFLGRIADRRGLDIVVIPSMIVLAICFALIPFVDSRGSLLGIAFPLGLAQGAVGPSLNTLIFARCSVQRRGTASAANASSIDIGYGVGSIAFGFVAAIANYAVVYLGAMLLTLLSLGLYVFAVAGRGPRPTGG